MIQRGTAMGIGLQLVTDLPTATVERHKDRRQKKVYVDVLQQFEVTMPYRRTCCGPSRRQQFQRRWTWSEPTPALDPRRYNLKTIFRRLARQKNDPMAPLVA